MAHEKKESSGFSEGSRLLGPDSSELTIKSIFVGKSAVDDKWNTIVVLAVNQGSLQYETQVPLREFLSSIDRGTFMIIDN